MKIIIKTKMAEMPTNCKECTLHIFMWGVLGCPLCKDWIEPQEFRNGKVKLENCPLEEQK